MLWVKRGRSCRDNIRRHRSYDAREGPMGVEHTFVMVKPDGVAGGLVGLVIARLEDAGMMIERIRILRIDEALARDHYAEHVEKSFFPDLLEFVLSGPVVAMEWSGESAIAVVRERMGPTDPIMAPQGTIRGDHGVDITRNVVHGSDSSESARRELGLFFGEIQV